MAYDEFMTPPTWIERFRSVLGEIDIDPASNPVAQQYIKARQWCIAPNDSTELKSYYQMPLIDGLNQKWFGRVFVNPPYSRDKIKQFTHKALSEWNSGNTEQMIMLVNAAHDTAWQQSLIKHSSCMLLVRGRIKFWKVFDGKAHEKWEGELSKQQGLGKVGNSPRYLNSIFYFGRSSSQLARFKDTFHEYGSILVKP